MSVSNLLKCIENTLNKLPNIYQRLADRSVFARRLFCDENANTQYKCNINRETKSKNNHKYVNNNCQIVVKSTEKYPMLIT